MTMQCTAPLGLDLGAGVGALPLQDAAVRATFARLELHVPTAVRALTGKEPDHRPADQRPADHRPADVDARWVPRPRPAVMRHPPLRKPAVLEPAYVQETLF